MIPKNRFFSVFRTAARGLESQRIAMGASAENLANANTSRTADGTAYAIKRATHAVEEDGYNRFSSVLRRAQGTLQRGDQRHIGGSSLRRRLPEAELGPITEVEEVERERLEHDPSHPDADAEGYVHYPDINVVEEMSRMVSANRVYEANLTSVKSAKEMIKRTLEI